MSIAADLAFVFHWSPDHIEALDMDEIQDWHKLAAERMKTFHGQV